MQRRTLNNIKQSAGNGSRIRLNYRTNIDACWNAEIPKGLAGQTFSSDLNSSIRACDLLFISSSFPNVISFVQVCRRLLATSCKLFVILTSQPALLANKFVNCADWKLSLTNILESNTVFWSSELVAANWLSSTVRSDAGVKNYRQNHLELLKHNN